jgi:hypothetical protein
MPKAKQLKVHVEDRPGMLAEVTGALADKGINLEAANAWVEGNEGIIRLVADKHGAAKRALTARGWRVEEGEVVEVELANRPGSLAEVSKRLGEAGINIEYVFVGTGSARRVKLYLGVRDVGAALKALRGFSS